MNTTKRTFKQLLKHNLKVTGIVVGILFIGFIGLIVLANTIWYIPPQNRAQATQTSHSIAATVFTTPPTHATVIPTQKPTPSVLLAEALTSHGDISGTLTTGINPHLLTHDNPIPAYIQKPDGTYFDPAPTLTQCSDFSTIVGQDYVAVIVGNIGSMQYAITIEINENNPAYMNPGTELHPGDTNSGGGINVYEMGGKNRRWQQVYGPNGQDTLIILHAGRVSGTIDTWMATTDLSQKNATSTLHMQGNWRCR